jgi:hypothetical protein
MASAHTDFHYGTTLSKNEESVSKALNHMYIKSNTVTEYKAYGYSTCTCHNNKKCFIKLQVLVFKAHHKRVCLNTNQTKYHYKITGILNIKKVSQKGNGNTEARKLVSVATTALSPARVGNLAWKLLNLSMCTHVRNHRYVKPNTMLGKTPVGKVMLYTEPHFDMYFNLYLKYLPYLNIKQPYVKA